MMRKIAAQNFRWQRFKSGANIWIAGRAIKHSFHHALDVKICSAHHNGVLPTCMNRFNGNLRAVHPVRHRERTAVRIGNINHVVRHAAALFQGWLGRTDVHAAVHLHAVRADALAAARHGERQLNGQRGLAAGGWAKHQYGQWPALGIVRGDGAVDAHFV